jgi:hypothetical protein
MDAELHVRNLNEIQDLATRAAYLQLLLAAERQGLKSSCNNGHVHAARVHDRAGRYVFSWSANRAHLLFYLRQPALDVRDTLPEEAQTVFAERPTRSGRPRFNVNNGGETTIRIETLDDARALADWLYPLWKSH